MRIRFFSILALFAAAPPAAAQATQTHTSPAGYTLQVPAAWRRVPDAALEELRRASAAAGTGMLVEARYLMTDSPSGLPATSVARMDLDETLTPEEFRAMFRDADAHATMEEAAEKAVPQADLQANGPIWDGDNGIAWTRMELRAAGRAVTGWIGAKLHPSGRTIIVLRYYAAPGRDVYAARASLLEIFRSLRVD
jgi:hypothetical protein